MPDTFFSRGDQHALALAEELGMRPLQAHCHHGLGTLYRQTGRAALARAALSSAVELYRASEGTSPPASSKQPWQCRGGPSP